MLARLAFFLLLCIRGNDRAITVPTVPEAWASPQPKTNKIMFHI